MRSCFGGMYQNLGCCIQNDAGRKEGGDPLIGYAFLTVVLDEAQLLNLCVAPEYRASGVGARILQKAKILAQDRGAKSIFLEVRQSNSRAIALYLAMGFNELGVRRGYYPSLNGREDALIMALDLSDDIPDE